MPLLLNNFKVLIFAVSTEQFFDFSVFSWPKSLFFHSSQNISLPESRKCECDKWILTFLEDENQKLKVCLGVLLFDTIIEKGKTSKPFLKCYLQWSKDHWVGTP